MADSARPGRVRKYWPLRSGHTYFQQLDRPRPAVRQCRLIAGTAGSGCQHSGIHKTIDSFRALSSSRRPASLDPTAAGGPLENAGRKADVGPCTLRLNPRALAWRRRGGLTRYCCAFTHSPMNRSIMALTCSGTSSDKKCPEPTALAVTSCGQSLCTSRARRQHASWPTLGVIVL